MNESDAPTYREQIVPICIANITLKTYLGTTHKTNQSYHNVLVRDLEAVKYIANPRRDGNYIRSQPIVRYYDENVTWPEHPLNVHGRIQGAIAIIHSKDDRVLLVRNRKLWGLPKGARSYTAFLQLKAMTDEHFRRTGEILEHDSVIFDDEESSEDNICREVLEETGIIMDREALQLLKYRNQSGSYCAYDGYYYEYPKTSVEHEQDLTEHGTDHENDELLWVSRKELEQLIRNHRYGHRTGGRVFNHVTYGYLEEYLKT